MDCSRCREALSARLDGEDPGVSNASVDHHLGGCAGCRRWQAGLVAATRQVRLSLAEPVPDLTTAVLADAAVAGNRTRAWSLPALARMALALVAGVQLTLALPGLLGEGHGASVHVAREHGAWELALAVGLLAAALRPWRAPGLLPVAAALSATLVLATALDVSSGHTTVRAESSHGLLITGLVLLVMVQRLHVARAPGARLAARA
jgi:predicted anti-sigma-YlaC factor YlaD